MLRHLPFYEKTGRTLLHSEVKPSPATSQMLKMLRSLVRQHDLKNRYTATERNSMKERVGTVKLGRRRNTLM
jgi:hypothetical protein